MLTNKIKELIQQLKEECDKESVIVSMVAFDKTGEIELLQANQKEGVGFAIMEQINEWEKMDECNCENCVEARKEREKPVHEFHVNSPEEFVDVLDRIARGDFD